VPALALSAVLGWPQPVSILATTVAAIIYSACGGITAVVWTDLMQMSVVLFSIFYSLALVVGDVPGGFDAVLDHAQVAGQLEVVTLRPDGTIFNLPGALVAYGLFAASLFGTGQQAVQRFLSCRDLAGARRAAYTAWAVGTSALFLSLLLGVCLSAWAQLAPGAPPLEGGDRALPAFIGARLPAGVAGLMLAAIFAASMSSLDSAIHSTATALLVDFVRRFSKRPPSPRAELFWARAATAGFGVLATAGAVLAAGQPRGVLETLVTWLGYFAGPLFGLFLLGIASRRANEAGVLVGVAAAFLAILGAVLLEAPRKLGVHPLWLAPASAAVTWCVGWVMSLFGPPPGSRQLQGLTWGRRAASPDRRAVAGASRPPLAPAPDPPPPD
jgi:SSS family solute:Na+ symporter